MDVSKSKSRAKISNVLAETRKGHLARIQALPEQRRMEMVFLMSMDAIQLYRAGLKAQGFPDLEIRKRLRSRPR